VKVIFNASCIKQPLTGIGHFAYQNLQELRKLLADDLIAYQFNEPSGNATTTQGFKSLVMRLPFSYLLNRLLKNYRFKKFLPKSAHVYLEPNFILFKTRLPSVPCIYDLSFIRHPETHPAYRVKIFKKHLQNTINQAKSIVTISEFSKQELIDVFKVSAEKIYVAHCGASQHFKPRSELQTLAILNEYSLTYRKFILVIGTFEPRKNLLRTCLAYAELPDEIRKEYPLIICGATGWGNIELPKQVAALINQDIRFLKYVPDTALHELTAAAKLSCYTSIYEGFGLPVLEAMQSGTPVITANISSMPEVAGDAAILVNPYAVNEITSAMQKIISSAALCQELSAKGLVQAQKFNWKNCAQVILNACRSAAEL